MQTSKRAASSLAIRVPTSTKIPSYLLEHLKFASKNRYETSTFTSDGLKFSCDISISNCFHVSASLLFLPTVLYQIFKLQIGSGDPQK